MKKLFVLCLLMALVVSLWAQESKEKLTQRSHDILAWLLQEDYDAITDLYEPSFAANNTTESLRRNIGDRQQQLGKLQRTGEPVIDFSANNAICRTPLYFEKGKLSLTINFAINNCITGLFITPSTGMYEMPEYVSPLSFREETINFGTEGWILPGVLTYPNDGKPHPVVIIVHDAGPLDKDGLKGANRIYRDLAWGLASKGICVFRYDKRSNAHGAKLYMQNYQGAAYSSKDETVDDAVAAVELMKRNNKVDSSNIFLLGHGQGGMLTPMIAQTTPGLKGIVLFGANARSIQDVLISQMDYLYPDGGQVTLKEYNEKKRIQAQAKYAKRKNLPLTTPQDSLPFGVRADYWNFLNAYQPTLTFEQIPLPALVMQGQRDFQTNMADYQLWQQGASKRKAPTGFKLYPTLNHLFISGTEPSKPAEYQNQGHVDEQVLSDLLNWMKELP
jgi:dienelactone hydrolase